MKHITWNTKVKLWKFHKILKKEIKITKPLLIAIDFDGCLTNDYVLIDDTGREMVQVTRKDGLGANRLMNLGIKVLIVSTEKNFVVTRRAEKMRVDVLQNVSNKHQALSSFADANGIARNQVWAVGNDINDLSLFAAAGLSFCPRDAAKEVLSTAKIVLPIKGGEGILNLLAGFLEK